MAPHTSKCNSPYVCADEAPNFIVRRIHAVVVIHNECELHPPLPLLGLRPAQELDAALGVGLLPLHGGQGGHEHGAANDVKHGGVMILIAMVGFGEDVAQMSDQEDDRHLALGHKELLLGGPAFEEGLSGHAISYCSMLLRWGLCYFCAITSTCSFGEKGSLICVWTLLVETSSSWIYLSKQVK